MFTITLGKTFNEILICLGLELNRIALLLIKNNKKKTSLSCFLFVLFI